MGSLHAHICQNAEGERGQRKVGNPCAMW